MVPVKRPQIAVTVFDCQERVPLEPDFFEVLKNPDGQNHGFFNLGWNQDGIVSVSIFKF